MAIRHRRWYALVLAASLVQCKSARRHPTTPPVAAPAASAPVSEEQSHDERCNSAAVRDKIAALYAFRMPAALQASACDVLLDYDILASDRALEKDVIDVVPIEEVTPLAEKLAEVEHLLTRETLRENIPHEQMAEIEKQDRESTPVETGDTTPPASQEDSGDGQKTERMVLTAVAAAIVSVSLLMTYKWGKEQTPLSRFYRKLRGEVEGAMESFRNRNVSLEHAQEYRRQLVGFYEQVYHRNDHRAWMLREDLVNEIDRLAYSEEFRITESRSNGIKPLTVKEMGGLPEYMVRPARSSYTPLFAFEDLGKVNKILAQLEDEFPKGYTTKQFEQRLSDAGILRKEASASGQLLEYVYSDPKLHNVHRWLVAKFGRKKWINSFVTWFMGQKTSAPLTPETAQKAAARFSTNLGIGSQEFVVRGSGVVEIVGTQRAFGQSSSQFTNLSNWFIRDVTPEMQRVYNERAVFLENVLRKTMGDSPHSRIVVSAADARVRVHQLKALKAGQGDHLLTIVGKQIDPKTHERVTGKVPERSAYPSGTGYWTVGGAFLENVDDYDSRFFIDNPGQLNYETGGAAYWNRVNQAKVEYMRFLGDMIRGQDTTMVVHRLAPRDVHTYIETMGGYDSTPKQVMELLSDQLAMSEKYATEKQRKALQDQRAKAQQIRDILTAHETNTRVGASSVEVFGDSQSVDARAVGYEPEILAGANSYKPYVVRSGNTFSIHLLIDAPGVRGVSARTDSGGRIQSTTRGHMDTGGDNYGQGNKVGAHDQPKVQAKKAGRSGGKFSMRGSTVVSFYFNKDFRMLQGAEDYTGRALRNFGKSEENSRRSSDEFWEQSRKGNLRPRQEHRILEFYTKRGTPLLFISDKRLVMETLARVQSIRHGIDDPADLLRLLGDQRLDEMEYGHAIKQRLQNIRQKGTVTFSIADRLTWDEMRMEAEFYGDKSYSALGQMDDEAFARFRADRVAALEKSSLRPLMVESGFLDAEGTRGRMIQNLEVHRLQAQSMLEQFQDSAYQYAQNSGVIRRTVRGKGHTLRALKGLAKYGSAAAVMTSIFFAIGITVIDP